MDTFEGRSDEELASAHLKGDGEAFAELVRRFLKPAYAFAYRYLGNRADAEDCAQESFVKAWRALKSFDGERKFKSWFFTIVKNTALDFLKKKNPAAFASLEDEGESFADTIADGTPLADDALMKAEVAADVQAALMRLPPAQREILLLYADNDFSFQEIAAMRDEPVDTVKSRYRRGLLKLSEELGNRN